MTPMDSASRLMSYTTPDMIRKYVKTKTPNTRHCVSTAGERWVGRRAGQPGGEVAQRGGLAHLVRLLRHWQLEPQIGRPQQREGHEHRIPEHAARHFLRRRRLQLRRAPAHGAGRRQREPVRPSGRATTSWHHPPVADPVAPAPAHL